MAVPAKKPKPSKNPIADLKKQQATRDAGIKKTIKGLNKKKTLGGSTY
jgi:hypothetical protein